MLQDDITLEEVVEEDGLESLEQEKELIVLSGVVERERKPPTMVSSVERLTIAKRMDLATHAVLDAKPPEKLTKELEDVDIEKWSRVLGRLYQRKDVKVDHTITAMGILGLFPVAVKEE